MKKNIVSSNLSIYYTWQNIKNLYINNKFKILFPTWNDEFELPDHTLYQIFKIYEYEYTLKKHNANVDNPSIRIYVNKIESYLKIKKYIILTF